jgi:type I restriction enzyme S subunit
MEVKPGYKQTEVGIIPEQWNVKTLGSLTSLLTNGFVGIATSAYVESDDGVTYIQGYNIQENDFNLHGIKRVSKAFHARNQKSCLQPGDLLTIQTGDIGVTAVVPPTLAGANCHALVISRFDKRVSEPNYYCQYFNSERGRIAFKVIETGSTMKHLNCGDMKRLLLPSPPVQEQRAIAEALGDVDALLGALDQLIAKKRDLKQAAMQQLLTGQTRLPGFHGDWEMKRLGDAGKCLRGVSYSGDNDLSPHDTPCTKRLLRSNNVQDAVVVTEEVQFVNSVRVSTHQLLKKDDILICMANGSKALVGKAGLFGVDDGYAYTFGAFMGCFRTDSAKSHPAFIFYLFQTGRYRNYINNLLAGSSINNLRPISIDSLEFSIPPLPEQNAIAEVLSDMDAELAALEQRRAKTRALKQGMMQQLLTGRTRLV